MIDPTIWKHRADITVNVRANTYAASGLSAKLIERLVATPNPFARDAEELRLTDRVWLEAVRERFPDYQKPRRRRRPPE